MRLKWTRSKPRVAIDVTPLLYTATGIARSARSLIAGMMDSSLASDLEMVCFGRRLSGPPLTSHNLGTKTIHLRLPRKAEPLIQTFNFVELTCRADLYHATDYYLPMKHADRAISTVHDVIFVRNPDIMFDHPRLAKWAVPFVKSSRAIITCSHWVKEDISRTMQIDPERIHVIYWGVDRNVFRPEPDLPALQQRLQTAIGISRPYFLAVSCSTGRKNTPRLLRAYAELARRGAKNDLVVLWDAPGDIRLQYEKEQSRGQIRFVGRVNDESLRDLYCGATAALYPSLDEGFGLPLLEAMTCGTPVITSNLTCLPEIAGDAAVLVDSNDQNALTEAMALFENSAPEVADLRERGLKRSQDFTWQQCARQTLDLYRKLLA